MVEKVEYIRYLHQFLLEKGDRRSSEVRDWLYLNSGNDDITMRTNIDIHLQAISESYYDLLSFKQWIRNQKINKLLD
jgi:hypothetical protein